MSEKTENKPKTPMAEMSDAEMAMRKFLKALGVTTHQKLESAMADAVASGKMSAGELVDITATIIIGELDFTHQVTATLTAPEEN